MLNSTHVIAAAGLLFAGALASGAAQSSPAKAPARATAPITTASGVYTAAQAARGEQTYMAFCVSCHPAGTYTAPVFRQKWNGQPLSALFDLVADSMPMNDPGSLDSQAYAQVVAYLLKINGAPAGRTPLPAGSAALKKIRIEMPRR